MEQTTFRGNRDELRQALRQAVASLSGRGADSTGAVAVLTHAVGVEALSILRSAYVQKARGGTDEAGVKWKSLDPRTIAYSRPRPGLNAKRKRAGKAGRGGRPLLTAALDKLWRGIFASTFRRLQAKGMSASQAKGNAAALAWSIVKAQGGKTVLAEYGSTQVEIGRSSGRLLASFSPGDPDNRLEAWAGEVLLGSKVKYASPFHKRRPIWPESGDQWPDVWVQRLVDVVGDGLKAILRDLARKGA